MTRERKKIREEGGKFCQRYGSSGICMEGGKREKGGEGLWMESREDMMDENTISWIKQRERRRKGGNERAGGPASNLNQNREGGCCSGS